MYACKSRTWSYSLRTTVKYILAYTYIHGHTLLFVHVIRAHYTQDVDTLSSGSISEFMMDFVLDVLREVLKLGNSKETKVHMVCDYKSCKNRHISNPVLRYINNAFFH